MALELTPAKALIFRITHIDNVPWLLANGLHCSSARVRDPGFVQIGNPELIAKRPSRIIPVSPGGSLGDYIPFYFTPCSPMLLNIVTGHGVTQRRKGEIVILVSSLYSLTDYGVDFVYSDRHAYLATAQFSSDPADLESLIAWKNLQARDFARDPNDPGKFEKYQAEALAHNHVPLDALVGIACHGPAEQAKVRELVQNAGIQLPVALRPEWFF